MCPKYCWEKNFTKFIFFQTKFNINFRWSIKFCTISNIFKNNTFSFNISSLDHNQTHYCINEIFPSNRLSPATCITIYLDVVTCSFLLLFILLLIIQSVLCFIIFPRVNSFPFIFYPAANVYLKQFYLLICNYIYIYLYTP